MKEHTIVNRQQISDAEMRASLRAVDLTSSRDTTYPERSTIFMSEPGKTEAEVPAPEAVKIKTTTSHESGHGDGGIISNTAVDNAEAADFVQIQEELQALTRAEKKQDSKPFNPQAFEEQAVQYDALLSNYWKGQVQLGRITQEQADLNILMSRVPAISGGSHIDTGVPLWEPDPAKDMFENAKAFAETNHEDLVEDLVKVSSEEELKDFINTQLTKRITEIGETLIKEHPEASRAEAHEKYKREYNKKIADILESTAASTNPDKIDIAKAITQELTDNLHEALVNHYDKLKQQQEIEEAEARAEFEAREKAQEEAYIRREAQQKKEIDERYRLDNIARMMMKTDPHKFGSYEYNQQHNNLDEDGKVVTGRYALLDAEGNVKKNNILRWVNNRILYYHSQYPDTPQDYFSQINIIDDTIYRQRIPIAQLIENDEYFKDQHGHFHEDLKEVLVGLSWLVGGDRNMDVQLKGNMSNDEKYPEVLAQLFQPDTFGKEFQGKNTLEWLFTLPAEFGDEGDIRLGSGARSAYLIYYHMTDYDKLHALFNSRGDFGFFKKDALREALITQISGGWHKEEDRAKVDDAQIVEYAHSLNINLEEWYDAEGDLKREKFPEFIAVMNLFDPPIKNREQLALAQDLVRETIGRKTGLKDVGDWDSMEFAELIGNWMTYWSGAAARNDIAISAVNAGTKTEHFMKYLDKQADESRAGSIGNPRKFGLQKQLTADFMTGILMQDGKTTILEHLERMEEIDQAAVVSGRTEAEKATEIIEEGDKIRLDQWAMRQYATQHHGNEMKRFLMTVSGKEPRLDKFAHYDAFGRVVYDHAAMAAEVQDAIIKPTRYALSTHRLKFGLVERELVSNEVVNGVRIPVYKDATKAEKMFNKQVLRTAESIWLREGKEARKRARKEKDPEKRKELEKEAKLKAMRLLDANGEMRKTEDGAYREDVLDALNKRDFARIIVKAQLLNEFGAMLYSHTAINSDYEQLNFATREIIIRALSRIPAGIVGDDEDFRKTEITARYFTDEDIKLLRKASGNVFWKGAARALGKEGFGGFARGLGDALGELLKAIFRV